MRFFVSHEPIAQPRQRHRIAGRGKDAWVQNYVQSDHAVHGFKRMVRSSFCGKPIEGPIMLDLVFLMPRPQRLIWKRRPMPRERHTSVPDLDNLVKSVQDSLKGAAWIDDSQVCELTAAKWYASGSEEPGVEVWIGEIEPAEEVANLFETSGHWD